MIDRMHSLSELADKVATLSAGESAGESHMTISRASGMVLVLTREQEALLTSIFWLALGRALEWQDKVCCAYA